MIWLFGEVFIILIIFVALFGAILRYVSIRFGPSSRLDISMLYLIFWLLISIGLTIYHKANLKYYIIYCFMLLGTIYYFNQEVLNKPYETFKKTKLGHISIIALFILLSFSVTIILFQFCGNLNAEQSIKTSDNGNLTQIKFLLDDENITISNKTLSLIMYTDGKYYVKEKDASYKNNSNIYIIPDKEVKMMTIVKGAL